MNQRGRLKTIEDIGNHLAEYREKKYRLIIIDAFYRAMPRGIDENDNGAIADVYNMLDRYAQEIGCAFVLIHHTSKGNQAQKSVTDVGAGAGSQSRAADTHLVLRRHKEEGVVVMDSVVRSFRSSSPVCLRWDFPLWRRDDSLDPPQLEGVAETRKAKTGTDAALEKKNWLRHIRELLDGEASVPKTVFTTRIEERCDVSNRKARDMLEEALDLGYLKCEKPSGLGRAGNAAKHIVLGPVDPLAEDRETASEEDGNWEDEE